MRYGVPDDDMPDSLLPPGWGPPPFDDRDLDAVLAGETADIPLALRPVADLLGTLHAPPTLAEFRGEATAMAEFRVLGLGQAARPAGLAPTLQLQALPAGPPRRRPAARHRIRRRAPGRVSRVAGTLTAVAAVAALVAAVAFTGNLPGPIQRLAGRTAAPSAAHSPGNSASPKAETRSAAVEPTSYPAVTPSASTAQPEPSTTCRTYFGYLKRPGPPSSWRAEMSVWQWLTKLAGSQNPLKVYSYCASYVTSPFPHWSAWMAEYPPTGPYPGTGDQGNTQPGSQNGGAGSAGSNNQAGSGGGLPG
jgi:hypothetical protein